MITTWGNVKRILAESSSVDVDKVHPTAVPRLREYALSALHDFISAIRKDAGYNSTAMYKRTDWVRELSIATGAAGLSQQATFLIDITNPVKVNCYRLDRTNIKDEAEDNIVKELQDVILPQAQDTGTYAGAWWADENMYPLRPLFKGEEPARHKPDPSWILIDPTTHEEFNLQAPKKK